VSNILFVLYHDFTANSAVHVHNFANQLAALGHSTAVAIPAHGQTGGGLGPQHYRVGRFDEIDDTWSILFPDGRPPAIVHAWTPRENVRLFCEKLAGFCEFALLVHLEDNEELILEANLGDSFDELLEGHHDIPLNLSSPQKYREFIASAAGVTIIMDRLEKFVPAATPKMILWPGADRELFHPRPRDTDLLGRFGVADGTIVFCYTGNVHSANARDVRSLYLAAAVLHREGTPAIVLRTGRDYCDFLGPDDIWARDVSIHLGQVSYREIPHILSLADALVQPGGDDAFNEFRLPGKLPEFFAMGLPVVVPRTNAGRFMQDREDALVYPKVDALTIASAVRLLRSDLDLRERLSRGALRFCAKHFDWSNNTSALAEFYDSVSHRNVAAATPV
jgi:glycosyltransferase involved in cell wall biosynthesis